MIRTWKSRLTAVFLLFVLFITVFFSSLSVHAQDAMTVHRTGALQADGYQYILDLEQLRFENAELTTSDPTYVVKDMPDINGLSYRGLVYDRVFQQGDYDLPGFTLRFSDCIGSYDSESYDLIMTVTNLHINVFQANTIPVPLLQSPTIFAFNAQTWSWGGMRMKCDATYQIVEHGTDTPVSGTMLLGFSDLDISPYTGRPEDTYREGFRILSGGLGEAWVEADTYLEVMDNGTTFGGTRLTSTREEELKSSVSFLADASGTTIRWAGGGCCTSIALDMKGTWPEYTIIPSKDGPGTITPAEAVTVNQGMEKQFTMTPDEHASLVSVTVDGSPIETDPDGMTYTFTDIQADHRIHAVFEAGTYSVRYDGNGSSNPDHLAGEQTQNQVTSQSGMPDSVFTFDVTGTLRANDFVREGYTFTGWNTKADGSGTSYPDGYDRVYNLGSEDGDVITLYAQWKKQLGTETITVVSEETGNPVEGVSMGLYRDVNGTWTEVSDTREFVTDENGQIMVDDLHWFDYEWRCIEVPAGYEILTNTDFQIRYDALSAENEVILYMKRVTLVLNSEVSDIIEGENPPAFLYQIEGTDAAGVDHTYNLMVQTDSSKEGQNSLTNLFAGTYKITQIPVSRYLPEPAENIFHTSVSGTSAFADLLDYDHAEVLFPYTIRQYGGFGHTDGAVNQLAK